MDDAMPSCVERDARGRQAARRNAKDIRGQHAKIITPYPGVLRATLGRTLQSDRRLSTTPINANDHIAETKKLSPVDSLMSGASSGFALYLRLSSASLFVRRVLTLTTTESALTPE
jgi:hypothetical protein